MNKYLFRQVFEVGDLVEDLDEEDPQLIVIVAHNVLDQELLVHRVRGQNLKESLIGKVGTLTILLGFHSGRPATAEKQRHLTEHIASAQVLVTTIDLSFC